MKNILKPTKENLSRIEELFATLGYFIRYEKGNFKSGYCILNTKDIIVVNKYFTTEGRFECLIDILKTLSPRLRAKIDALGNEQERQLFDQVLAHVANPQT
jgi:hypothetical protein